MFAENREKGSDAVRSSSSSINYKTGGICKQKGRSTHQYRLSGAPAERNTTKISQQKTQKKNEDGRGCIDNCHVTYTKIWWVMNNHIGG
jgi:hypothetical protein